MPHKVSTCLWFDKEAEEAVNFYVTLLPGSAITKVTRYGGNGPMPEGTVLTIAFQLGGRDFMALNGGPHVSFNHAHSMVVTCDTQAEIDRLWAALLEGGGTEQQCGWLTDRYGLSWQVVPSRLPDLLQGPDQARTDRVMAALMTMVKLDVGKLQAAYEAA